MVWNLPYISSDLIKENLICITFGKPLVSVKLIESVARRIRGGISPIIHSIQMEDDPVPSLVHFLDESWSSHTETENGSAGAMVYSFDT